MTTDIAEQAMMKISSKCPRCGGLLYSEKIYDQGQSCEVLHCMMCGTSYDSVIVENRMHSPKKELHRNIANMRKNR